MNKKNSKLDFSFELSSHIFQFFIVSAMYLAIGSSTKCFLTGSRISFKALAKAILMS